MKLSPQKMAAFCAALAETGMVMKACRTVDISRRTAYQWREDNPDFAAEWDRAVKIGVTALEDEAHRRAFDGVPRPVFYSGQEVGATTVYSDTLTMFLLKAHFPERYRDRMAAGSRTVPGLEVITGVPSSEDDDANPDEDDADDTLI